MNPVALDKWPFEQTHPLVIAGPCSAESEGQVLSIAHSLAKIPQVKVFRAGLWKPRTRPNSFEGVGEIGLPWLQKVKQQTGLLTAIEVANAKHVELALKFGVDILWIGARTTVNPFSVQEIADALKGSGIPVMVKNPINADLALWIGALERVSYAGINRLMAIHRGFSSYGETKYRNKPNWNIPMELKRCFPDLPIICDPSHITGRRDMIQSVSQKAMDINMNGVMIETHNDPDSALSDASQQVTPESLANIINSLEYRTVKNESKEFEAELEMLRRQIDRIDHEILDAFLHRMDVVNKIGAAKKENNITVLQVNRMDEIMKERTEWAKKVGLRPEYIKEIYNIIHNESVKTQTDFMQKGQTTNEKHPIQ